MKRIITLAVLALILCAGCTTDRHATSTRDDSNPLTLLATGWAADIVMKSPKSTPEQKANAYKASYNAAYKWCRAGGFSRSGAKKYATAWASDMTMPELSSIVCSDYETPPTDCRAVALTPPTPTLTHKRPSLQPPS